MTLPTIIQKQQEKVTVTKVKEAYSIVSQAYLRAVEENGGDISTWGCFQDSTSEGGLCVMDKFAKFLNVISSIRDGSDSVPYTLNLKENTNNYYTSLHSISLSNGFIVKFKAHGWRCNIYEKWDNVPEIEKLSCTLYIDINGSKGPNALGRDVFNFKIHKQTLSPVGNRTEPYYHFGRTCKHEANAEFWDGGVNGMSCAGWVITNENMDYLHCSGLSWNGKTKCKQQLFN